jgi:predicted aspartyl protease
MLNTSFKLNTNKPYARVFINGDGPHWFLLDTGSIYTVVDTESAETLGISATGQFEATGGGEGSITGATANGVALSLNGLDFSPGEINILPIDRAISFSEGLRVEGLLGYDFFHSFVVTLDYVNQLLSIHEPATYSYSDEDVSSVLPLNIIRGHPFVSANLTTDSGKHLSGTFLVDTGWRSALSLNAPFVAEHGFLSAGTTIEAVTGVGIGGSQIEAVGRVAALQLGSFTIQSPVVNFSTAKAGILSETNMSGIIGGEVLRRFRVTFDYSRKQMVVQPNAHFTDPYEFDMSGLMMTAEGENLKTLRVHYVIKNAPGYEAGLRPGDIITAIDGQLAETISLERVRRLFKLRPEKECAISVLRGEQTLNMSLRLRRLI